MWKTTAHATAIIAVVVAGSSGEAQTQIPPTPKDFVGSVSQSNQYEILAATVATVQSHDPRVVSFAEAMISQHVHMDEQLRGASDASRLPPPNSGISSDQAALLSALQSLRGTDFDRTYAAQQILAHAQAVAVIQSFAKDGRDKALKRMAQSALPIVKEHLKLAQQLSSDVGAP